MGVAGLTSGKMIVVVSQAPYGAHNGNHDNERVLRLNVDGSIDSSFAANAQTTDGGEVRAMTIQPDDKILIGGRFTAVNGTPRQGIARFNADGTLDTGFATITLSSAHTFSPPYPGVWGKPAVQTDGSGNVTAIYIIGDFENVSDGTNNVNCPGVARLAANGTVDTSFQPTGFTLFNGNGSGANRPVRGVVIQSNGQVVIGGRFQVSASFASNHTGNTYNKLPLIRLNSNGSADQSYGWFGGLNTADASFIQVRALAIQPDDKVLGVDTSVYRFNTDGSLDSTFHRPVLLIDGLSANTQPANYPQLPEGFSIDRRPDGHVLIGGVFTDADGSSERRWGAALFNSDGTADTSFVTSDKTATGAYPTSFLHQSDGTTLIAFNQLGGFGGGKPAVPHNYGRLSALGELDASFDPLAHLSNPITARGFTPLPNGDIFVFGTDNQYNFAYAEIKPDGTPVVPSLANDPNVSFDIALPQPNTNGQILILSSADPQHFVNDTVLQRLNADGSVDNTFTLDASVLTNTVQRSNGILTTVATDAAILATQSDGKILFSYLATDSTYRLVRLNANGSVDSTFQAGSVPASAQTYSAFVQDPQNNSNAYNVTALANAGGVRAFSDAQIVSGNKFVVAGQFVSYGGTTVHGIVRLNPGGTVDNTFQPGNGAQWTQTTETATFHPGVDNIELLANGKLLVTGTFEAFDGVPAAGIALLSASGVVDSTFTAPAVRRKFDYHTALLALQPDNSFLLSGPYSFPNQTLSPSFIHIFGPPQVTTPPPATATDGQLFVYQIVASNQPTSYSASGLPPGLNVDTNAGVVYGKPTATGNSSITLSATNSLGTGSTTLSLAVQPEPAGPAIISSSSATGKVGEPFKFQILTDNTTASAAITTGGLPAGLSFNSTNNVISGTPTDGGNFLVTLTLTDGAATVQGTLQVGILSDPMAPVVMSAPNTVLTPNQPFSYTISSDSGATFSYIGLDGVKHSTAGTAGLPQGLSFDGVATFSGTPTGAMNNVKAVTASLRNRDSSSVDVASNHKGIPNTITIRPPSGLIQIVAKNDDGTGTQPLNFFQPTTFASWKQQYFTAAQLNDPTYSCDSCDPANDGLSNLLKYAFNLDPTTPAAAGRPRVITDPNYLSLVYTKSLAATDLTYTIQESTHLRQWTPVTPTNVILSDDGFTQTIQAQVPRSDAGNTGNLYIRLQVSH